MEDYGFLRQRSIGGFIWKLFEKIGAQLVAMIIQIVLARLLLPSDYGIIGYLTLFMNIMDVFLRQGFTTALIQKKDADEIDYSTVFIANVILSIVLYFIMFMIAPLVALYYSEPKLINIMRVLSLNVVIGSLSTVHNAVMTKKLEFKKSFMRGLANTITYGVVGITLAMVNFGVWSLVFGKLAGAFVGGVVLWITVKWKPERKFSFSRLKGLFKFSSRVLGTDLLETFFHNIHALIIGRIYTSSDLGFYQRGQNIPQTVMTSIDGSMTEVMYPTFSLLQNDKIKLKSALQRSMKLSMFVCMPILVGLCVTAEPLTLILLTDKWLPSIPYMRVMCIVTMFWPLAARLHALKALGKSQLTLRISLINNSIYLIVTILLARFGPIYIMISSVITNTIGVFITSYFVKKHINYSLIELIQDIGKSVGLSVFMGGIVYLFTYLSFAKWIILLIQIIIGIIIYVLGSIVLKIDSFYYILDLIKEKMLGKTIKDED